MKKLYRRLSARRARLPWALIVVVCLAALAAFGRAGGGGNYSGGGGGGGGFSGGGGGSGGSGGSGGGDGLGLLLYFLIRLCVDAPAIGIPLVIAVLGIAIFVAAKGGRGAIVHHQGSVINRGQTVQRHDERAAALARIRQHDPSFDETALAERVKRAFVKLQNSWCDQNLSPIRPFVTDGILERFSLQIDELKARGLANRMENLLVHEVKLAEIHVDAQFETATFRIRAAAVDKEIDQESERVVSGGKGQEEFTEYWSFIRRPGGRSVTGTGLLEGNCPNCAAALELSETAKCQACGALVKSGQYDWVLAEITQACEWRPHAPAAVPGVAALQTLDPTFSAQQLEDRVSVMFWRTMATLRLGHLGPVRKMASEEFCQTLSTELARDAKGIRRYPGHCGVGSVETLGVLLGEPMDKALVEIRWSGILTEEDEAGRTRQTSASQLRTDVFVVARRHGAKGHEEFALASAHCAGCGSAVHESAADACEYCGMVLNDGENDWLLIDRKPLYSAEIQALRRELLPAAPPSVPGSAASAAASAGGAAAVGMRPGSNLELAAWMVGVMVADGEIDPRERELLETFALRRGLTSQQIDQLARSAEAGGLEAPAPATPEETRQWLEAMAEVALADGLITKPERAALAALGSHVGYSHYDINQIILRTRSRLYKASRENLRKSK